MGVMEEILPSPAYTSQFPGRFSRIHLPIPSALPLLQPTRSNVSEKWLPLLFAGRVPAWIDLKCHNFVVYFF